jgi:hypothetical protein
MPPAAICSTTERADTVLNNAGVAMDDCYIVEIHSQFISSDLRKRRLLALTVW